jgi:ABC-type Fe3+/spermidine/putrescine transport system ATPase subunit
MATVELDGVSKHYGDTAAVDGVSLRIDEGEFAVLLGPSGCGKTTTLRLVAGLIEASAGRIRIGGRDVTDHPPYRRNLGIVFQNYALFPHLTVFENVAFGLRRRRIAEAELERRVAEALELVRLGALGARMPRQLSGGQQQRVAIARALAVRPDVLLLDEPLSNLDAKLRHDVRQEIRALQQMLKLTTILVTHDQEEAMSLGDRLVVMNGGRVQQIGTPPELYRRPANLFVASFIGSGNILRGRTDAARGRFVAASGLALACRSLPGDADLLLIRQEAIKIAEGPGEDGNRAQGTVEAVSFLGSQSEVALRLATGERLIAQLASSDLERKALAPGKAVSLWIDPDAIVAMAGGAGWGEDKEAKPGQGGAR